MTNHYKRLPWKILIRVALIVVLLTGFLSPPFIGELRAETDKQKDEIVNLIINNHVSGIAKSQLNTENIDTIISSLGDPYTQYFTPDEWKQFMNMLENNYVGIGIRVGSDERGFYVNEVFPDTPALGAGMQDGDYIIAVEGKSTQGITTDELIAQITGVEGTEVQITIQRDTRKINLNMARKAIHIPALTSRLFDNGTGYIRVSSFSSDADELFAAELKEMQAGGLNSLVLDLRNNPGGLLDTAASMAAQFIKKGSLIHTVDRTKKETAYPISGTDPLTVPVTVLVNAYSASASEVLAGALQDYNLATIMGTKTFGKGSVQSLFTLSEGGVLKLTIQEYLTPLKHKVNQVGISPDLIVQGDVSQLVTALQHAGPIDIKLSLKPHSLSVNGQLFNDRFKVIRENGVTYVPSRVLAAIVDGNIAWEASTRSVRIEGQADEGAFLNGEQGFKLIDGVSYIELAHFQAQFPSFDWQDKDGQLLLLE
ncbi:MAG: S41 family peptidase [Paenibacillaceae bacterium]